MVLIHLVLAVPIMLALHQIADQSALLTQIAQLNSHVLLKNVGIPVKALVASTLNVACKTTYQSAYVVKVLLETHSHNAMKKL